MFIDTDVVLLATMESVQGEDRHYTSTMIDPLLRSKKVVGDPKPDT